MLIAVTLAVAAIPEVCCLQTVGARPTCQGLPEGPGLKELWN